MEVTFHFTPSAWQHNNARLTNQIFKLLPMYENGEDWEKQLSTIILELYGYNGMFEDNPAFMVLISKLYALKEVKEQVLFRKLIFETISLLKEIQI